ncbi:MAG: extracellular solute-binding protein [Anaerolineaceae bacterium]|nr:extracellular solute-binding protein [Anaerolineaceae bacterium]
MNKKINLFLIVCLALSVILAACQSAPPPTAEEPQQPAVEEPQSEEVEEAPSVEEPEIGGQVNYLGWEGYELPEAFQSFYDEYGVVLNTTYIGSNDEVITKMKAGGPGTYDVGDINARYFNLMATTEMIIPLDESKLPNLEDLFPAWKERGFGYIDGQLYAVPAFFSTTGICYRADLVSEPDWTFYTNPEYQGKYAVSSNGMSDMYIWAMTLGLGQDATKWTQDDLALIKERGMEEFREAATMVTGGGGEMKDLLVRGDVVLVTDCWSQVAANSQKEGVDVQFVTPAGPIKATVDIYFIFTGAPNLDAAYAWLNQAISAEALSIMGTAYDSAVTNMKAYDLMTPELKEKFGYDSINDIISLADFNILPDPDAQPPYVTLDEIFAAFEEIKASSGQ